jgi:hypothetical protein
MTSIDLKIIPVDMPSLCIPRVFPNIDERRIRKIFESLNMGVISRVDIVRKNTEKGENFNRVFIHWKYWNNSENANISRDRLLNGKEIKIIYDEPWFWKVSAYRDPNQKKPKSFIESEQERRGRDTIRIFKPRTPDCSPPPI